MEKMTQDQINFNIQLNRGTSKTKNETFERQGYLIVRNLIDPKELCCEVPKERGQITYFGKLDRFQHIPVEQQVEGSLARYYYPPYKESYFKVKKRLETIIQSDLLPSYYYDRFYFEGQDLKKHVDRDACEISVSIHIQTNLKISWGFKLIDVNGKEQEIFLNPGDGLIYKGCEICHWRDKIPTEYRKNWFGKKIKKDDIFYHQIFMHYVLANGIRVHFANDIG